MQIVNIVVRLLNIEETKTKRCMLSCFFVYRFLVCFFALSLSLSLSLSLVFFSLSLSLSLSHAHTRARAHTQKISLSLKFGQIHCESKLTLFVTFITKFRVYQVTQDWQILYKLYLLHINIFLLSQWTA